MHELSIAQSIVEGACEEALRHPNSRVSAVHLQLGELSGVVKEALLFSYGLVCEGTRLEGSRLEIEEVGALVFCENCRAERQLNTIQQFCCPVCLEPTPNVVKGRELLITGLEIEHDYHAAAC